MLDGTTIYISTVYIIYHITRVSRYSTLSIQLNLAIAIKIGLLPLTGEEIDGYIY